MISTMQRKGRSWCAVCEKDFIYPSKLKRHYDSGSHSRMKSMTELVMTRDGAASRTLSMGLPDPADNEQCSNILEESMDVEPGEECGMVNALDTESESEDSVLTVQDIESLSDDDVDPEEETDFEEIIRHCYELDKEYSDFSPFSSKSAALLFIMWNGLNPISEKVLKFFSFALKQVDSSLPSIATIKKTLIPGHIPPSKFYSSTGIPFYVNLPTTVLKICLGNPKIAQSLKRYPMNVAPGSCCDQIYKALKWNTEARLQAPMIDIGGNHIFIGDFIELKNGEHGKTRRFFQNHNEVLFVSFVKVLEASHKRLLLQQAETSAPVSDILGLASERFLALVFKENISVPVEAAHTLRPISDEEWCEFTRVHHLKRKAGNMPVFSVPLVVFSDDSSGSNSKKWNGYNVWYLTLCGLTKEENAQMENIHFLTCSKDVPPLEMAIPIVNELVHLEEDGLTVYDAYLKQNILVVAPVLCGIADNPRASEICNHQGSSALLYCRFCMCNRKINPHLIEEPRTMEHTKQQLLQISQQTTVTEKKRLMTQFGVNNNPNCMLKLPLDIYSHLPIDCLHTILLGPYKYLTDMVIKQRTELEKKEIISRIVDMKFSGINGRISPRIVYHHKSFHGRDFKAWAQVALYILWPYLSPLLKKVWLALSKVPVFTLYIIYAAMDAWCQVFKMCYCDSYVPEDHDSYEEICWQFSQAVKDYNMELFRKPKFHLILHLPECMKQFGPTSAFNCERFEAFNGVFRSQNMSTNQHSSSKDVASSLSLLQHLKFVRDEGEPKQCGTGFIKLLQMDAVKSFVYGPKSSRDDAKKIYQSGCLRKCKNTSLKLIEVPIVSISGGLATVAALYHLKHSVLLGSLDRESFVSVYSAVICSSKDMANVGDYVMFKAENKGKQFGHLKACFATKDGKQFCLVQMLEPVTTGNCITNEFDCPLLSAVAIHKVISSRSVLSPVSILHECLESCKFAKKKVSRIIEREQVEVNGLQYEHDWSNCYFFHNIYAMN